MHIYQVEKCTMLGQPSVCKILPKSILSFLRSEAAKEEELRKPRAKAF